MTQAARLSAERTRIHSPCLGLGLGLGMLYIVAGCSMCVGAWGYTWVPIGGHHVPRRYVSQTQSQASANELGQEDLASLPIDASKVVTWLHEWATARTPDMGIPKTNMPVKSDLQPYGVRLTYQAALSNHINILVESSEVEGSTVKALTEISARTPKQIRALIEASNEKILDKLSSDLQLLASMAAYSISTEPRNSDSTYAESSSATQTSAYDRPNMLRPGPQQIDPVNVEKFKDVTMDKDFARDIDRMMEDKLKEGFLQVLQDMGGAIQPKAAAVEDKQKSAVPSDELKDLFEQGSKLSEQLWRNNLMAQSVAEGQAKFKVNLKAGGLKGGIDIFAGPGQMESADQTPIDEQEGSTYIPTGSIEDLDILNPQRPMPTSIAGIGRAGDPATLEDDKIRLFILFAEMNRTSEEMYPLVLSNYKDLLLSENFVYLIKAVNSTVPDQRSRGIFSAMTSCAGQVMEEVIVLAQREEMRHLRLVQSICRAALGTEEQFLQSVQDMRLMFDADFVSYLKYAIDKEKAEIRAKGLDPRREPTQWLQVLMVVRKGVISEVEKRFKRDLEMITMVIRFDDQKVRRELLERFVQRLSPLDLLQFRQVATNMIDGVLSKHDLEIPDATLVPKMKQLHADLEAALPFREIERRLIEFCMKAQAEGQDMEQLQQLLVSVGALPAPEDTQPPISWNSNSLGMNIGMDRDADDETEIDEVDQWQS